MTLRSLRRRTVCTRKVASQRGHPVDHGAWRGLGQPAGANVLHCKVIGLGWMMLSPADGFHMPWSKA